MFQDLTKEPPKDMEQKRSSDTTATGGFVFTEPKRKKARKNLTLDLKPKEKSEHIEFDLDVFLDSIPRPPPKQEPQCPRCMTDLTFDSIQHDDGRQWEYYRCPMSRFNTKCYVTCGKENLATYLKAVEEETHPCYAQIAPEKFKCACDMSMILAMSKSEKNPRRLYLKYPERSCKLFQRINDHPEHSH